MSPATQVPAPPDEESEASARPTAGDSIRILLKPVLLKLPDPLKVRVRQPPSGPVQISIPLHKVLAQLPQGSVRISFGELRQASPAGVFSDASDQDQTTVELSLPEILAQLKPDQLARRNAQRKVEVPADVGGIFGAKGEQLTALRMTSAPTKAPLAPSAPKAPEAVRALSPEPASRPALAPQPSIPAPALQPTAPIKPISPLPPPPPIKPSSPLPAPSALRPPAAPTPALPAAPVPAPPAPIPSPPPSVEPIEPLVVPLVQLMDAWPDPVKQALAGSSNATLSLPADELEPALKRGKILFPWKRIRSLINPPLSPSAGQGQEETQLELPLSVIAPLFMARKRPVAPQRKYTLGEQIPDLFTSKGMMSSAQAQVAPPATAPAAPSISMPAPIAPVSPPVAPLAPAAPAVAAVPAPPPPEEIGEVFGQPGRKNWTPSEIVQRTSGLKGVAGALIAMQDGLLVAGHLPPGLNGETIAAFLPQMFSRMLQYSKELKFGEANNLTIIVDNVPLKIFKVGGVFFTVLGRAEEPLPEPHLSIVAAQLGPQNK